MDVGAAARVELVVTAADTAVALGSGDVEVLATPRLVALTEEATVRAVAPGLAAGQTTVGTRVELEHMAATPIGRTVEAEAWLVEVDGRRLAFVVEAHEGSTVVARGRVERVVVDRQRFLDRVSRS
jgi:fluoroacetyl-CoA thioesterase